MKTMRIRPLGSRLLDTREVATSVNKSQKISEIERISSILKREELQVYVREIGRAHV